MASHIHLTHFAPICDYDRGNTCDYASDDDDDDEDDNDGYYDKIGCEQ